MDGLFLRQVWAGGPSMLLQLQGDRSPEGLARAPLFPPEQGPVVAARSTMRRSSPGVGDKPGGANFYPAGATKAEVEQWIASLPAAEKAEAQGFFTTIRRGPDGRFIAVPLHRRVPGRAGAGGRAPARGGRGHHPADPEALPREPRRRLLDQRLLRERRGLDGARRLDRADHRPLRDLRGRVVQLPRRRSRPSSRCATTPRRPSSRSSPASCRGWRTACPSIPPSATRSSARSRPSASSTSCSAAATATAACRRRRSTSPTTSASSRRRAPSGRC